MSPRRPTSLPRRSWRESPARLPEATSRTSSKKPLIVFLTLAVLGLFAGFAWLLWQPVKSNAPTYFVALLTGESDLLSVPRILFEEKSLEPLKGLDESGESFVYIDASQAQHAGNSEAIEVALQALPIPTEGRLIVYVSAHGVSDNGQPYVLAPGFDLLFPEEGRYQAAELIEAVSQVDAETKLVVFDCSRLAVLPRMGMAANEFVTLVEEAARKIGDQNLWIMTAGGELETSPLGLAEQQSILGAAIAEAIAGDADLAEAGGNGDYSVSLAELHEFVQQRLARSRTAAPIPRLVYSGGESDADLLKERTVRLLRRYRTASATPSNDKEGENEQVATTKKPAPEVIAAESPVAGKSAPPTEEANLNTARPATPAATSTPTASAAPKADSQAAVVKASPAEQPATSKSKEQANGSKDEELAGPSEPPGPEGQQPLAASDLDQAIKPAVQTPAAPQPNADNASPWIEAWQTRDRLEAQRAGGSTLASPIEYAPHLWNELNATLVAVHLEQLSLDKDSPDFAKTQELVDGLRRGLKQLADQQPATYGGLITDSLGAALREYDERRDLDSLEVEYAQALLDLRSSLSRANHYIQWHGAMLGSASDAGEAREAARLIRQVLEELALLDNNLKALESTTGDSMDETRARLRQLDGGRRRLSDVFQQLNRRVATTVERLSQDQDAGGLRQAEILLTTSLPTAEIRKTLVAALRNSRIRSAGAPRIPTQPNWNGLFEHLRLEILLVQLVDPAAKDSPHFEAVLSATRVSGPPDAEARQLLRTAGRELRDFYAQLPVRIADYRRSSQPNESRAADKLIAIMHPRDASSKLVKNDTTIGFIKPRWKPPGELGLSPPPQAIVVNTQDWVPITWTLNSRHIDVSEVEVTLESFDSPLHVRFAGQIEPARQGDSRKLQGNSPLKLEAIATEPQEGSLASRTKEIRIKVRANTDSGERVLESRALATAPRPNRVVLTARCVDPQRPQPVRGDQCLRLQPYPNRTTTFHFELANFSDDEKHLRVDIVAVPAPTAINNRLADIGWPPGRILDESLAVAPLLAQWANEGMNNAVTVASAELTLPADEQPRRVEFKAPGAAPPPAPAAKEGETPAAPPPEPEKPAAIDVTYGLACRVVNKERPQETFITWLEVVPLHPARYVDFRAEVIDREIQVTASPNDANSDGVLDLPPGIAEKPISLVARGDNTIFPAGSVVPVNLGPASRSGLLTIQPLESVVGRPTFSLEVDGFPRAVAWRVDLENPNATEVRSPASLRFERIAMQAPDATRSRLYRLAPHLNHPPIDEKQWPIVIDVEGEPICAFDTSAGARPLEVRFRADAARDAFNTVGGGNAIVLAWQDGIQPPTRRFDDRAVRSQVTEVTKTGDIKIDSTVDDFVLSLEPPGVNNKAVKLTARMTVQGAPEEQVDSVIVVFDERPPQLAATLQQPRIWEGTPHVGVTLAVEDLSGVAAVEAWVTDKPPRTEAELDSKGAEQLAIPDAGAFLTNEVERRRIPLQVTSPLKEGSYRLILRVTDRSGQQSTTLAQPLSLAVVKRPPPVVGPVIGDLKGTVMLGSKVGRNLIVTVEGTNLKTTTDDNGRFVIKRLKANKYKLVVSGWAGREVTGEHEVTLAEMPDYDGKVVIVAKFKPLEPPK